MSQPGILIIAILALAALYVLLPIMITALRRFRGHERLRCPERGQAAEVNLDRRHAAFTLAIGKPHLRVRRCSLWSEKSGCSEACLKRLQNVFSKL